MLDQLLQLGKEQLGQTLSKDTELNDEQVDTAFKEAGSSIMGEIIEMVLSGNLSDIVDLFNGKMEDTSGIQDNLVNRLSPILSEKLSISYEQAETISTTIITFLINKFTSKETGTVSDGDELMDRLGINKSSLLGNIGSTLAGFFSK